MMSPREKNKAGKRKISAMVTGHAVSNRVPTDGLCKLAYEEKPKDTRQQAT